MSSKRGRGVADDDNDDEVFYEAEAEAERARRIQADTDTSRAFRNLAQVGFPAGGQAGHPSSSPTSSLHRGGGLPTVRQLRADRAGAFQSGGSGVQWQVPAVNVSWFPPLRTTTDLGTASTGGAGADAEVDNMTGAGASQSSQQQAHHGLLDGAWRGGLQGGLGPPLQQAPSLAQGLQQGVPPLTQGLQHGVPPLAQELQQGGPPLKQGLQQGEPPLAQGPQQGVPPLAQRLQQGVPPLAQGLQQAVPPLAPAQPQQYGAAQPGPGLPPGQGAPPPVDATLMLAQLVNSCMASHQAATRDLARSLQQSQQDTALQVAEGLRASIKASAREAESQGTTMLKTFKKAVALIQATDGKLAISDSFLAPVLGACDDFGVTEEQLLLRHAMMQIILSRRPQKACLSDRVKTEFLPLEDSSVPKVLGHLRANLKSDAVGFELSPMQWDKVMAFRETVVQQVDGTTSAAWQAFPSSSSVDESCRGSVNKAVMTVFKESQLGRYTSPLAFTEDVKEQLLLEVLREQAAMNRRLDRLEAASKSTSSSGGGGKQYSTQQSAPTHQGSGKQSNGSGSRNSRNSPRRSRSPRRHEAPSRSSKQGTLVKQESSAGRPKMPAADDPNGCFSCWTQHRPHDHSMASCTIKPWGSLCIKCLLKDGYRAKDVRGTEKEKRYLHKETASCG